METVRYKSAFNDSDTLNPRLYQHDFLHIKKLLDVLIQSIGFYLKDKESLEIVDIACGTKPYFPLFKGKAQEYIGLDIEKSKAVDIVSSAEKLPFADNQFDVALCTQALEHIRDYQAAVDEMYRTLKLNGIAFLSTIGVWEIHGAPHDYWRFTEWGLREVFNKYKEVEVIKNGGAVLCFFQILNIYLYKLNKYPLINLIAKLMTVINNLLGWHLDKLLEKHAFFVGNYLVVAKK